MSRGVKHLQKPRFLVTSIKCAWPWLGESIDGKSYLVLPVCGVELSLRATSSHFSEEWRGRAGEMGPRGKSLLNKHGDLSSIPNRHIKASGGGTLP